MYKRHANTYVGNKAPFQLLKTFPQNVLLTRKYLIRHFHTGVPEKVCWTQKMHLFKYHGLSIIREYART